jgi:hypothetical protein
MRQSISMAMVVLGLLMAQPAWSAPDPAQRCAADKLRAAAKKAQGLLTCHASAVSKGQVADPACLQRAMAKFEAKFAKIEARGGCVTVGDVGTIEGHVDAFVDVLVAALPATTTSTTSTTTTSCPPTTAFYCGLNPGSGGTSGFCPSSGLPLLCPSGMACETTGPSSCTCAGAPKPCGDIRAPLCQYGTCPDGQTCQTDFGSGTCPPTCGCQ